MLEGCARCVDWEGVPVVSGVREFVGQRQLMVGLLVFFGRVTRTRQNKPSNTQEPKQRAAQQRTAARSSANLTKPNKTPTRYTLVRDTTILHIAKPQAFLGVSYFVSFVAMPSPCCFLRLNNQTKERSISRSPASCRHGCGRIIQDTPLNVSPIDTVPIALCARHPPQRP